MLGFGADDNITKNVAAVLEYNYSGKPDRASNSKNWSSD
jgi:hypothetical protein